jgi:protein-S-isoprenylcysteine O-methyltransferase Ste14
MNNSKSEIKSLVIYAPVVYLIALILGIIADSFYYMELSQSSAVGGIGLLLVFLATILILWAQYSLRNFQKIEKEELTPESFSGGPYKFSRHPTYMSLAFLVLGLGLMVNSLIVTTMALVAFVLVYFFILRKEESILERKYGDLYSRYKHEIHPWI